MIKRSYPALVALVLIAASVGGCGSSAFRIPPRDFPEVAVIARESFERYNSQLQAVRLTGKMYLPEEAPVDFAAKSVKGAGVRFDAMSGPFLKILLSIACVEKEGCDILVPDERTLYRDPSATSASMLSGFITGRMPVIAGEVSAWRAKDGRSALRLDSPRGYWQVFVIDEMARVSSVIYGEEEVVDVGGVDEKRERIKVEIVFEDFRSALNGDYYPSAVVAKNGFGKERLRLAVSKVIVDDAGKPSTFSLNIPAGTNIDENGGSTFMKYLGFRPYE